MGFSSWAGNRPSPSQNSCASSRLRSRGNRQRCRPEERLMDKRGFLKAAALPIVAQAASSVLWSDALAQTGPPGNTTGGPTQRIVEANGIRINIAEQGTGPLVVLCHGFPECWYSWRHQVTALAAAGFHAVAPDMRGYGKSDRPETIDQYSIFHLVGDMVGLLDALDAKTAVIVGH